MLLIYTEAIMFIKAACIYIPILWLKRLQYVGLSIHPPLWQNTTSQVAVLITVTIQMRAAALLAYENSLDILGDPVRPRSPLGGFLRSLSLIVSRYFNSMRSYLKRFPLVLIGMAVLLVATVPAFNLVNFGYLCILFVLAICKTVLLPDEPTKVKFQRIVSAITMGYSAGIVLLLYIYQVIVANSRILL